MRVIPEEKFDTLGHLCSWHVSVPEACGSMKQGHRAAAVDFAQAAKEAQVRVGNAHVILIVLRHLTCTKLLMHRDRHQPESSPAPELSVPQACARTLVTMPGLLPLLTV